MKAVYVSRDEEKFGPYDELTLKSYLQAGNLSLTDHAWEEGMEDWVPLHKFLGVPPPPPPARSTGHRNAKSLAVHSSGRGLKLNGFALMGISPFLLFVPGVVSFCGAALFFTGFVLFIAGRFSD